MFRDPQQLLQGLEALPEMLGGDVPDYDSQGKRIHHKRFVPYNHKPSEDILKGGTAKQGKEGEGKEEGKKEGNDGQEGKKEGKDGQQGKEGKDGQQGQKEWKDGQEGSMKKDGKEGKEGDAGQAEGKEDTLGKMGRTKESDEVPLSRGTASPAPRHLNKTVRPPNPTLTLWPPSASRWLVHE